MLIFGSAEILAELLRRLRAAIFSMRQSMFILEILHPTRRGLMEITEPVRGWTGKQGISQGMLTLFCRHTSASLLIQENAARAVRNDLEKFFDELAPEGEELRTR